MGARKSGELELSGHFRLSTGIPDLSGALNLYHDPCEVFSKDNALSLSPHRPGSRNHKPDALYRQFPLDHSPSTPVNILPEEAVRGRWKSWLNKLVK